MPDFGEKLIIYEAATERSVKDPTARLRLAPSELSEATEADDVILPWNPVASARRGETEFQMVGLSLPRRTWLRQYFVSADLPFDYEAEPLIGHVIDYGAAAGHAEIKPKTEFSWALGENLNVNMKLQAIPPDAAEGNDGNEPKPNERTTEDRSKTSIVVVPANLLAWVTAHRDGLVEYDSEIQLFVPRTQSSVYDRARLYATTIDNVPATVKALAERQFAVMSETGRITEIHRQDESLQLLVWVVGLGVFLFGIVTVFSVLMDSTDRKRATIGILRVMGMSRAGIFASILLRATVIGAAAALLSLLCGFGLTLALGWTPQDLPWLNWKPVVAVQLHHDDLLIVVAGAMLCCCFGAIPPAWKASRMDPFDAIVEGRFR